MSIKFSLKAVPLFKVEGQPQKYAVKELYSFVGNEKFIDGAGTVRPKMVSDGLVDEDIKAQNPREYSAFHAYYEANQDKLNALALASPNSSIDVEALMKADKEAKESKVVAKSSVKIGDKK